MQCFIVLIDRLWSGRSHLLAGGRDLYGAGHSGPPRDTRMKEDMSLYQLYGETTYREMMGIGSILRCKMGDTLKTIMEQVKIDGQIIR